MKGPYRLLRAILPLTVVTIEFCWLYPWILFLTGAFYGAIPTPLLPPGATFGLLALGYLMVRWTVDRAWSLSCVRMVVAGVGLAAGLAAVKMTFYSAYAVWDLRWIGVLLRAAHDALPNVVPAVTGALAAALLWWRGVVLGEREFSYFEVDRAFRRGVGWTVLFTIFFVIYGGSRGFAATAASPAYLLVFFSLSLIMLALTRALAIWQENQADDAQALAANRHWLLLLIGVVGLIISGAVVLSGAVSIQFRPVVLRWLRLLEPVVEAIFLALFAVAIVIAKAIILVLSHLPRRIGRVEPPPGLQQPLSALLRQLPPHVVGGARWGMVVFVVVLLMVLVALAVIRARRRPRRVDEDERESVWSTQSLLAGIGQAWRNLWARRRGERPVQEVPSVASIRAIYRELLRIGRDIGAPRSRSETPYEYRPRLSDRLPQVAADVSALTEAYVRVRYSPAEPSEEDIERAQTTLKRIRDSLT